MDALAEANYSKYDPEYEDDDDEEEDDYVPDVEPYDIQRDLRLLDE